MERGAKTAIPFPPQKSTVFAGLTVILLTPPPVSPNAPTPPQLPSPSTLLTLEGLQFGGQVLIAAVLGIVQELLLGADESQGHPSPLRLGRLQTLPLGYFSYLVDLIQPFLLLGLKQSKGFSSCRVQRFDHLPFLSCSPCPAQPSRELPQFCPPGS